MATMHKRRTSKLSLEPNPFEHSFSLVRSEDVKAITEEAGCNAAAGPAVYAEGATVQLAGASDNASSADRVSADQAAASISPGSNISSDSSDGKDSSGNNGVSAALHRVKLPPVTAINGPMHAAGLTSEWGDSLRSGPLSPAMLGGPASSAAKGAAKATPRLGLTDPMLHTGLTPYIMGEIQPVVASGGFDCMKLPSSLATPGIQAIIKAAIEGQEISTTPGGSLKIASSMPVAAAAAANADVDAAAAASSLSSSSSTLQAAADAASISSSVISARHQVIPLPSMALTAPPQVAATMALQGLSSARASQPPAVVEPGSTQIAPDLPASSASIITVEGCEASSKRAKRRRAAAEAAPRQKKKRARPSDSSNSNSNGNSNGNSGSGSTAGQKQAALRESSSVESRATSEKPAVDGGSAAAGQAQSEDEKRRQFLERNRIAALKCRQRKKKQLKELQERHDFISMQNEALRAEYLKLRELSLNLRALLVAHRDCPVAQANGVYGIDSLPIGTPSVSLQPLLFSGGAEGEQAKEIIAAIPPANNGVPVHSVDPSTGKPIVMAIQQPSQPRPPSCTASTAVDMFVGAGAVAATGVSLPMIAQQPVIVDPKTRINVGPPRFMAMNN
ncbi:Transcription factor [Coemansia sp. RSA 2599]|nr:Transcription factor [Coemansia sp. RSA 2599]